jgi:hypothetical protein
MAADRVWAFRVSLVVMLGACAVARAQAPDLDTARIEGVTGLRGTWNAAEKVFKVTSPRGDVPVNVDGWTMPPFMGLTSWAAFMKGKTADAVVAGDLVLFQDEVSPAMSAALENGLSVTALHNHFFFDEPKVYFMHIGGEGRIEELAWGVRRALDAVKAVRAAAPRPASGFGGAALPDTSAITPGPIETVLGAKGQAKDGMLKIVIGRTVAMACGCEVGKDMGVNTWAAFAGTDEDAVVDGDFAVLEDELQATLMSLRRAGIHVVAIHHHMTHEAPRMLFLHYWGRGRAANLAASLRAALDAGRAGARGVRVSWDDATAGGLPAGWVVAATNPKGAPADWRVAADAGAPSAPHVLSIVKINDGSSGVFNLCWAPGIRFQNGAIEAKIRANAGDEDQGGGLIWRVRDADSYYIARYNPLEGNLRLYIVKDGARRMLKDAGGIAIPAGRWFTLRVVHHGGAIEVWLDGEKRIEASDATFPDAGGVGFWTKADAATSFDDLAIMPQ